MAVIVEAQNEIGYMYEVGDDVTKDKWCYEPVLYSRCTGE